VHWPECFSRWAGWPILGVFTSAGGSPRAASPPLDRATSAPVFEDDAGPSSGSGEDDEAHSGYPNGSAAGGTLRNRFASPPRSVFEGGGDFADAPSPMRMDLDSDADSDLEVRGTASAVLFGAPSPARGSYDLNAGPLLEHQLQG
jgi:hypothetical protein